MDTEKSWRGSLLPGFGEIFPSSGKLRDIQANENQSIFHDGNRLRTRGSYDRAKGNKMLLINIVYKQYQGFYERIMF